MSVVPEALYVEHETVVCSARFPGKESQEPKKVYYFAIQALGELPRLLLEYTETPYDSVMFFSSKSYKSFTPFGQMPCYQGPELGDMYLAQSSAICRHIARHTGIYGETPMEQAMQDMLWEAGKDIYAKKELIHFDGPSVDPRFDGILQGVIKIIDDGKYLSGKNPGFGEVCLFHSLQQISEIKPEFLNSYEKLKMFVMKIKEIPSISNYLKSPRRIPLTENELGHAHTGAKGYKYISPLNPDSVAKSYVK